MGSSAIIISGKNLKVDVRPQVCRVFDAHRQRSIGDSESFGAMIGSCSPDHHELWIDEITTPLPGDSRRRAYFHLKDKGHQRVVDKAFDGSQGVRRFLGTWHTHPECIPVPSRADRRGWKKCLQLNPEFPNLVFIIVGTDQIRAFVAVRSAFIPLKVQIK